MQMMLSCRMRRAILAALITGIFAAEAISIRQEEPAGEKPDPWQPLGFFAGRWEGTGEGRWGHSAVEREYEFVLGGKFLFARNKSVYPPQEKNPEGEVHTDWSMISYDTGRKTFVLRQFHDEAFVNYDRAHRELHSRLEGPRDLPHPRPGRIRGGLRAGGARR
jgi:hypothetical protein